MTTSAAAIVSLAIVTSTASALKVSSDTDACTCLRWEDVYKQHNVSCVLGRELDNVFEPTDKPLFMEHVEPHELAKVFMGQLCDDFYMRIPDNFCLGTNFSHEDLKEEQWCYVSSECQQLGTNGMKFNDELSMKTCSAENGQDYLTSRMSPEHLRDLALKHDIELEQLIRLSYRVVSRKMDFDELETKRIRKEAMRLGEDVMILNKMPEPPYIVVSRDGKMYNLDHVVDPEGKKGKVSSMCELNGNDTKCVNKWAILPVKED